MKVNKKIMMSLMILSMSTFQISHARDAQFENLWNKIEVNGLSIKSSQESVEAAGINKSRQEKHWYPNVYATGSTYLTNDPGANMFGLLSQREIKQSDFMPDSLNHPGTNLFTKGALGLNVSLYEGGMKEAMKNASSFQYESKKSEKNKNTIDFYSEVAKNYFTLTTLNQQKLQLNKINSTLDGIISRYQIGNKSNMLGYSGLLGLKSLKNRLIALQEENKAKHVAYSKALNELSGTEMNLLFNQSNDQADFLLLLDEYLPSEKQLAYEETEKIKSLEYNAKAAVEIVEAEKSRNLPRVGAFVETYAFNGDRKTATGVTTGLYLNWNLFSGNDIGASSEAIHQSKAAKYYAEAVAQQEKMEFNSLSQMEETLKKTLKTLEESQRLLDEQTNVANSLFKNGMINALQLVEVLSRRVDLINSKSEVETNLIASKAKKIIFSNNKPALIK